LLASISVGPLRRGRERSPSTPRGGTGVVVEVHLGVEGEHLLVLREDERVDLGDGAVVLDEALRTEALVMNPTALFFGLALGEAEREREVADLVVLRPGVGSKYSLRIFSGVWWATSSMSMPPSVLAMIAIFLVSRSTTTPGTARA
jgi:hypothetical protein